MWNQNRRQPPSLKIPRLNLVSKASNPPPLIMPIKSHFPLFLSCMNRMLPCIDSNRIVEPNPLHDLSFVHSSKQTTILADIGIVCDLVAPAIVTTYMHV